MISNIELKKLIQARCIDVAIGCAVYPENSEISKKQQEFFEKSGLFKKNICDQNHSEDDIYGIIIPYSPTNYNWNFEEKERLQKKGNIYKKLIEKETLYKIPEFGSKQPSWMMADSMVSELTISEDGKKIQFVIEGIIDYTDGNVNIIDAHVTCKNVRKYQIDKIEKGNVITDNQNLRRNTSYDLYAGPLGNDFYWIYRNGCYSLLFIIAWITSWCVQIDFEEMDLKLTPSK